MLHLFTGFSISILMRGIYLFCVDMCVGMRSEISEANLSKILPEEVEEEVRQAAEISMGTEVLHTTLCTAYMCTLYVVHQGGEWYVIFLWSVYQQKSRKCGSSTCEYLVR